MPATVLIVDDDESTCEALSALLAHAGYDVLSATSFQRAKEILRERTPDVMVVDIRLGGFNGLQLIIASEIPIPAVVVSGFRDPTLEAEAQRLGADFLEKPIEASDLVAALERKLACT